MVSRAMSNFGYQRLVLIDPQCELDQQASKGAAEGQQPLRDCIIYPNWEAFASAESEGPRIAFSRRDGRRRPVFHIDELNDWSVLQDDRPVSLIFGTEDHGLSGEDLKWAHRTCTLEIPGSVKSLNLSHAVLLALSQWYRQWPHHTAPEKSQQANPQPNPQKTIHTPDEPLRRWLEALNFDITSKNWNAFYALRQMIMKASPTHHEMELFTSVVEQTLRVIRGEEGNNKSRKNNTKPQSD